MDKSDRLSTQLIKSVLILVSSFIIAFNLQLLVHEFGHLLAGMLLGESIRKIIIHPFGNSQIIFKKITIHNHQVIIGVMGIVMDFLISGILMYSFRRIKKPITLFIPMWFSIAFIGEGIGMLGNISAYYQSPRYIEDIAQLFTIGFPVLPVYIISFLFIVIGIF